MHKIAIAIAMNMHVLNSSTFFFLFIIFSFLQLLHAVQQSYPTAEYTMDCRAYHADNAGYLCEPTTSICETLSYFHVQAGLFSDLNSIATQLFNTTPSSIAEANGLSASTANMTIDGGIYVPFTCACNGNLTAYNTTYTIRPGDTFVQIANITYEGLTTCQAMQAANPNLSVTQLEVGDRLVFPLRCACPSQEQKGKGIKLLVTYPVGPFRESISSVITMFGISEEDFLAANNIGSQSAQLFPATTVLLPFFEKPMSPPNGSSMHRSTPDISTASKRPKTDAVVAIAVAGGLTFISLMAIAACFAKKTSQFRRSLSKKKLLSSTEKSLPNTNVHPPTKDDKLKKDLFEGMSTFAAYEKLASYSLDEIKQATQNFHPTKKIKGSVYRGTINGKVVAVKGMTRDVSKELQILRKVNHMNLVSLLGVCIASPKQTYLVYEFAENGSLHDWLHGHASNSMSSTESTAYILPSRHRLQIALDVATAMEYMHNHTSPSYVHMDINTHNILLDANMRGKIANFAMAKPMEDMVSTTRPMVGKSGYMSPEYVAQGNVSPRMDVYAYGVVLLEMLVGEDEKTKEEGSGRNLAKEIGTLLNGQDAKERLREWIDPCLRGSFPLDCAYNLAVLARSCVAEDPSARPNAREIAFTLSKLLEMFPEWEPPSLLGSYSDMSSSIEAR